MNARELEFDDSTFDFVFSISSIEHFGGHKGSMKSMKEISRVLKPGGVASITTEVLLTNNEHVEFFRPHEIYEFLILPSGSELIEPLIFDQPSLEPFIQKPSQMPDEKEVFPHFVLKNRRGFVWTSITFFLKKPII